MILFFVLAFGFIYFFSVLVVINHYMAFQYFAEEYYAFSEVSENL